jgi:hypothetical protein
MITPAAILARIFHSANLGGFDESEARFIPDNQGISAIAKSPFQNSVGGLLCRHQMLKERLPWRLTM